MLSVPLIIQGHDGFLQPYRLNMGNSTTLCPASPREAENTESHVRVHEYLFPMYVVKVSDFLQMEGAPEPHHVLKEKGVLHEWRPGMFVLFISHQWLGAKAPDPSGQQLFVLRQALKRFMDKSLLVEEDLTRMFRSFHNATSYEQVADGYLFLDWFAIPQITARTDGVNEDATRSDAALAVQSIPAYVEACDLFVALVPEQVHSDTGLACNYMSWLSRGWCRAELWCRLLSIRHDTKVIVLFSAKEALYILPYDWQRHLVADGLFTVESDRAVVVKLGEMALNSKISHLRKSGMLTEYRFYLARRPALLKQQQEKWNLQGFLDHFCFPNLEDAVRLESGMTGMMCAIMAGDVDMLKILVEHRADPNGRIRGLAELGYYDEQTPLMVAVKSYQEPHLLSALMSLHADPNGFAISGQITTPAWLASRPGHVRVLLENRADLVTTQALNGVAGRQSSETLRAFLETKCDPTRLASDGFHALHAVPVFGRANPDACNNLKLLLSFRADVNVQASPTGPLYWECLRAGIYTSLWGLEGSAYMRKMASLPGSTPLSVAATFGDKALVQLLLENHADLQIANDRGDTPEDLARACGYSDLLPILSTFAV